MPRWVPTGSEVARETLIVLAGALLAAAIVGSVPGLREWIRERWGDAPR